MDIYQSLAECEGFEWDKGNILKAGKNTKFRHQNANRFSSIYRSLQHRMFNTHKRSRVIFALGRTDAGRHLFIVFAIRENLIRVISARDMNRKERRLYETS